jgi:hypothetical protein
MVEANQGLSQEVLETTRRVLTPGYGLFREVLPDDNPSTIYFYHGQNLCSYFLEALSPPKHLGGIEYNWPEQPPCRLP